MGFGTHGHRDMEIVSTCSTGALAHQDSMGNGSVIVPGDVQRMSAGTRCACTASSTPPPRPVHFLQIWIDARRAGVESRATSRRLPPTPRSAAGSRWSPHATSLYAGLFTEGESATHTLAPGRHAWIHIAKGRARVNGTELTAGDALALSDEPSAHIEGLADAEILVFDLP
jgi:redox-sensitive bicupin YhaK (pirin superfamily)